MTWYHMTGTRDVCVRERCESGVCVMFYMLC